MTTQRLILDGVGIGLIAPSGALPDNAPLHRAVACLSAAGARVKVDSAMLTPYQRFAGNDTARLQALYAYLDDPEIDLIIAARGGYGLTRLLPEIDFARLAGSHKIWLGHSDFNVLQFGLLARSQVSSWVGPMACYDFGGESLDSAMWEHFIAALGQDEVTLQWPMIEAPQLGVPNEVLNEVPNEGTWQGTLWGGNLSVLVSLLGTPYFPQIHSGILFLEDVNEHPYRLERMWLQLLHAGVLDAQQAIVLGDFSHYRLSTYDAGYDLSSAVQALRQRCQAPVMMGLPFGHCAHKVTLPLGAHATLQVQTHMARLSFAGMGLLRKI